MDGSNTDSENTERLQESKKFWSKFLGAKGSKALLALTLFLALGSGCTVGIIPDVITDRYARLNHGYEGSDCGSLEIKPVECQAGTDDAQAASSWSNVALSLLALIFNPLVGSHSDLVGRRNVILASLFVSVLPSLVFFLMTVFPHIHPIWYYLSNSLLGIFNFIGLVFSALSDIMEESYRAQSYGVFIAVFFGGYAVAPSLPLVLNHFQTIVVSLLLYVVGFVIAAASLTETLPDDVRESALESQRMQQTTVNNRYLFRFVLGPFREMSILGRDKTLALLAAGSFVSAMVFASDSTLVLFYIEDQLAVDDKDIAQMFLLMGTFGLLLQGGAVQPLIQCLGERGLLIATFLCGTLHNFLYGAAKSKFTILVALMVAQLTKLNTPVLSSMASKDASKEEQGRIQGALAASNAIAFSLGPLTMEFVYHNTKAKPHLGPGFMFYYAAMLYFVGMCLIAAIPQKSKPSVDAGLAIPEQDILERGCLEEPLLEAPAELVEPKS